MKLLEQSQSRRKHIAGIPCDFISQEEYAQFIKTALGSDRLAHIITLNPEMVVQAQQDNVFMQAIAHAELIIPDGTGILWAREYAHAKTSLPAFLFSDHQPLPGIDSIFLICKELERQGGTAYVLGGEKNDRNKTAETLQQQYPKLEIIALEDSFLQATRYKLQAPSAIFVALGAPKQALWIEEHRAQLERAGIRVAIGVGGAFAMISGRLPRAPKWMRRAHLEWLWRLLLEPRRAKRIWNAIIVFPTLVFWQKKKPE